MSDNLKRQKETKDRTYRVNSNITVRISAKYENVADWLNSLDNSKLSAIFAREQVGSLTELYLKLISNFIESLKEDSPKWSSTGIEKKVEEISNTNSEILKKLAAIEKSIATGVTLVAATSEANGAVESTDQQDEVIDEDYDYSEEREAAAAFFSFDDD